MTIVRIVLADPRTGGPPDGGAVNGQHLVVLADDTGHRAVPLWLPGLDFKLLWWLLGRPARDAVLAGVLEETAARLLHSAGVAVRRRTMAASCCGVRTCWSVAVIVWRTDRSCHVFPSNSMGIVE